MSFTYLLTHSSVLTELANKHATPSPSLQGAQRLALTRSGAPLARLGLGGGAGLHVPTPLPGAGGFVRGGRGAGIRGTGERALLSPGAVCASARPRPTGAPVVVSASS